MNTTPTRICPTCGATMEQHGRAWVCPKQRNDEKVISAKIRESVRATIAARVPGMPF